MNNLHLFELINAPPGLGALPLALATWLARWVIWVIPLAMAVAWVRGSRTDRRELLQMVLAGLLALGLARIVGHVWPQPRPFALHLGQQYLAHANDAGLPSDHATLIWSIAIAALVSRGFAVWAFPMLALGLLVGWARVFLGVHFPLDIAAALPVSIVAVLLAVALRAPLAPASLAVLSLYDRLAQVLHAKRHPSRKV